MQWQTIVFGGAILGLVTTIGVVIFALVTRALEGTAESVVQMILVLAGGIVFSVFPALRVRPTDVDSIAWSAMLGLMGALVFTVLDTAILRPLNLYHWRWDAIGGGSGFWYVPVWWMGSALIAWLGAWSFANASRNGEPNLPSLIGQAAGVAILLTAILTVTGLVPFGAPGVALAFTIGLVFMVPLTSMMHRG
jgi:hypothetical protein